MSLSQTLVAFLSQYIFGVPHSATAVDMNPPEPVAVKRLITCSLHHAIAEAVFNRLYFHSPGLKPSPLGEWLQRKFCR
jgi:hypothetical protein